MSVWTRKSCNRRGWQLHWEFCRDILGCRDLFFVGIFFGILVPKGCTKISRLTFLFTTFPSPIPVPNMDIAHVYSLMDIASCIIYDSSWRNETDCKLSKAYDEMRDSYLQLKEQYSNLFKENQRLKDAGHTYEGTHANFEGHRPFGSFWCGNHINYIIWSKT